MTKSKIIEQCSVERDYGFNGTVAIVDHKKYGRILIEDGFGGIDGLGGCVGFKHGRIIKLQKDDTFEKLNSLVDDLDYVSILELAENGYDSTRPVMTFFSGRAIQNIATSIGL